TPPAARPAERPASAPTVAPAVRPPDARPSAPVAETAPKAGAPGRAVAERVAAEPRTAPSAGETRPAGRASLWNGLVKPLDMTAATAADSDPAAAREASDRDYETHILGMKADPARPALGTAPGAPGVPDAPAASAAPTPSEGNKVFVTLQLDPREAGSLRDAVAGLGSAAGFTADARFEMTAGPGGRTLLSGWLPASRLADALSRPGVKRLSVEPRARPSRPRETTSPYLIGLRLDDPSRARRSVDEGVRALADATGFRLTRVVGLETGPDGRAVAVVAGELPISRLSRAMGLPQVAKLLPAGAESPVPAASAASAAVSSPASASLSGFGKFALARGPWLIVLTLLLALPSIREPLRRAVSVLNPYR
ncbi:MAG: hypothetical protein HY079_09880, partial [Elusimicrobia bacterium]|nr:hypothetical protein [Elusimicrobiota bacterium]